MRCSVLLDVEINWGSIHKPLQEQSKQPASNSTWNSGSIMEHLSSAPLGSLSVLTYIISNLHSMFSKEYHYTLYINCNIQYLIIVLHLFKVLGNKTSIPTVRLWNIVLYAPKYFGHLQGSIKKQSQNRTVEPKYSWGGQSISIILLYILWLINLN